MELALEAGAEDVTASDESWEITCDPSVMTDVIEALKAAGLEPESNEVARIPKHVKDMKGIKHDLVVLVAEAQDVWEQQERMIGDEQFFPLSGQY